MARTKRIALALPDEADQVLTEIAEALNKPKTTIVTEIFLEALPTLKSISQALIAAKTGAADPALQAMAVALKDAGFKLDQVQSDLFALQREQKKGSKDV